MGLSKASKRWPFTFAAAQRNVIRSAHAPNAQSRPPKGAATKAPEGQSVFVVIHFLGEDGMRHTEGTPIIGIQTAFQQQQFACHSHVPIVVD